LYPSASGTSIVHPECRIYEQLYIHLFMGHDTSCCDHA
jgi:hypothetical protein